MFLSSSSPPCRHNHKARRSIPGRVSDCHKEPINNIHMFCSQYVTHMLAVLAKLQRLQRCQRHNRPEVRQCADAPQWLRQASIQQLTAVHGHQQRRCMTSANYAPGVSSARCSECAMRALCAHSFPINGVSQHLKLLSLQPGQGPRAALAWLGCNKCISFTNLNPAPRSSVGSPCWAHACCSTHHFFANGTTCALACM